MIPAIVAARKVAINDPWALTGSTQYSGLLATRQETSRNKDTHVALFQVFVLVLCGAFTGTGMSTEAGRTSETDTLGNFIRELGELLLVGRNAFMHLAFLGRLLRGVNVDRSIWSGPFRIRASQAWVPAASALQYWTTYCPLKPFSDRNRGTHELRALPVPFCQGS
jgi:hypothetical protein